MASSHTVKAEETTSALILSVKLCHLSHVTAYFLSISTSPVACAPGPLDEAGGKAAVDCCPVCSPQIGHASTKARRRGEHHRRMGSIDMRRDPGTRLVSIGPLTRSAAVTSPSPRAALPRRRTAILGRRSRSFHDQCPFHSRPCMIATHQTPHSRSMLCCHQRVKPRCNARVLLHWSCTPCRPEAAQRHCSGNVQTPLLSCLIPSLRPRVDCLRILKRTLT